MVEWTSGHVGQPWNTLYRAAKKEESPTAVVPSKGMNRHTATLSYTTAAISEKPLLLSDLQC